MDIQRTVREFVSQGKSLYRRLRSDGETLSDVDLVTLREQLHILDTEAGHLQEVKEFRSEAAAANFVFDGRRPHTAKAVSRKVA